MECTFRHQCGMLIYYSLFIECHILLLILFFPDTRVVQYLVRGDVIHNAKTKPNYIYNLLDADMAFCTNMRNNDVYLHVTNRLDWYC